MWVWTALEYISDGVAWLIVLVGFLAIVAGCIYLSDVLLSRLLTDIDGLKLILNYIRDREDFKQYKKDRASWEEKQKAERDRYSQMIRESLKRKEA